MRVLLKISRHITAAAVVSLLFAGVTSANSVSEGYTTSDDGLKLGMAASLSVQSTGDQKEVERASLTNFNRFVGVVTTLDENLIALTDEDATVYVTNLGKTKAFASDLNGEIKKGDFLTVSPLKGVLMRAHGSDNSVVGTALEDFPKNDAQVQEVTGNDGSTRTVLVTRLQIDLNPRNVSKSDKDNTFLLLFGQSLTGKPVNQIQVVVAMIIFFFLLVVEGSIVYGAIYSTITALGRNPLARTAVYKQLFQVGWVAFIVLAFGLSAIYAVLWI